MSACQPQPGGLPPAAQAANPATQVPISTPTAPLPTATAYPGRPLYGPGELVDYTAQSGDTLPALAVRFNTSVGEILKANSFIPAGATTMPPGMPMKIPIYYLPFWGTPYRIIPDSLFVNGPVQVGFDTTAFVEAHPGWLKNYSSYVSDANRSGAEIVDYFASKYSVSPRLLLALLEYESGALSQPTLAPELADFPLGYRSWDHPGLFMQLSWAANTLGNGYYAWRTAAITTIEYPDGRMERFDPWQNAATVSLHLFFNRIISDHQVFLKAIGPEGFAQTYATLFGDPWANEQPHLPGSLVQPEFILPFEPGLVWSLTGGPHSVWGIGEPLAAIDFAPPAVASGCLETGNWAVAMASGVIVRSADGEVMIDTDGDGDERTGWDIFYLHIGTEGRVPLGAQVKQGDRIGHPSCEGGHSTGTHQHIARKYNGEWMPIGGIIPWTMEGWQAHAGVAEYEGTLTKGDKTVLANTNAYSASFIHSDRR